MSSFEMTGNGVAADWMVFIAILLAVGIGVGCFIIWYFTFHRSEKRRRIRRRRREHRKLNPTLAQTGGLPPPRAPNQPPRGA